MIQKENLMHLFPCFNPASLCHNGVASPIAASRRTSQNSHMIRSKSNPQLPINPYAIINTPRHLPRSTFLMLNTFCHIIFPRSHYRI